MKKRRLPEIDSVDRRILKLMLLRKTPYTGNEIAERIDSTTATINKRLKVLRRKGLVKATKGKDRIFKRPFVVLDKKTGKKKEIIKKVIAPSKINWVVNIRRKRN